VPQSRRSSSPADWLAVAVVGTALALLVGWWLDAQPVAVADGTTGRLHCISYAPSAAGTGDPRGVTREQLHRDLALLAQRTDCVRTYTVADGFDQVPAIARELGLEVLLGAWIGGDAQHNEREVALVIDTAKRHRDTVRAIVVGNEVLLRHELTPEQLAVLIRRVATETGMPVTYADVWGFWVKHRALAQAVSFVTVHIIPYWDDDPVGIDAVIPYVDALHAEMQRSFPGKAVLIGETGWPSAGRPRGAIEPGRVNQARYLRGFTALAERRGIDYNVIEAFDQPWKRAPEGTVGGYWGLYDSQRREKFPWLGPVAEAPQGRAVVAIAVASAAVGFFAGWLGGGGAMRLRRSLAYAGAAALLVAIGTRQWLYLEAGNVAPVDWAATLGVTAAGWLAFGHAIRALASIRATGDPLPRWLILLLLLCGAYVCLGLVFAGRHRDFPVWLLLPAALGIAITAILDTQGRASSLRSRRATDEVVLAAWLVMAGVLIPLLERFQNGRSIGWGLTSVLLGLGVLLPLALQSRQHQGAAEQPDAGPRKAVKHHAESADRDGERGRDR
jgi:exo-beta-1,3-glucanase (GH17 family)